MTIQATTANYTPPSGIPTHGGLPQPADAEYFVAPPPEIGPIMSAFTTLKTKTKVRSAGFRLGMAAIPFVVMSLVILLMMSDGGDFTPGLLVFPGIGLAIAIGVFFWLRFSHTCSYVGKMGIAKYTIKDSRQAPAKPSVLLFQQATELRTSTTNHYHNGIYTGTNYSFTWTNGQGVKVYTLSGDHKGHKKLPKPVDPFHFARVAEMAWSDYLFELVAEELAANGHIHFNTKAGHYVNVGPGFFEFGSPSGPVRCEAGDITTLTLSGGQFNIKHKNAKWYSSAGKFGFPYASMANARLFLFVLDKMIVPALPPGSKHF